MVGAGAKIVESRGGIDVAGDFIPQALQEECAEHDEAFFVIDVEDIFVAAAFYWRGGGGSLHNREIEYEGSAIPRLAIGGDGATEAGDDSMDDGKTQASALPDRLGGKERIEDAVERGAIHTAAIVADGQTNVTAFVHVRDCEEIRG